MVGPAMCTHAKGGCHTRNYEPAKNPEQRLPPQKYPLPAYTARLNSSHWLLGIRGSAWIPSGAICCPEMRPYLWTYRLTHRTMQNWRQPILTQSRMRATYLSHSPTNFSVVPLLKVKGALDTIYHIAIIFLYGLICLSAFKWIC